MRVHYPFHDGWGDVVDKKGNLSESINVLRESYKLESCLKCILVRLSLSFSNVFYIYCVFQYKEFMSKD